jgi:hypothetical protein
VTVFLDLMSGCPARENLDDRGWRHLLKVADRALCTPLLLDAPGLPAWVRSEVSARVAKITERRAQLIGTYRDAAGALELAGIEFVLLKGFTHEVDAGMEPTSRAQGDVDLLCRPRDVKAAEEALRNHGFEFHAGAELSDNHGRPLLKPHAWQWRGDYFDPAQPVPVELHHSIWNARMDRIPTPGVEGFWERREWMEAAGLRLPVFCDIDRLGVAALHLLRHVLGSNVRPGHAWELARMLERRRHDASFWRRWEQLHPAELRRLEVLAFGFVTTWFAMEMPPILQAQWRALPAPVRDWFAKFALSPMENLMQPNKDVVWLHLALLPKFADRWVVARRRLLPLRWPGANEVTKGSYLSHVARRGRYHALALVRTLWSLVSTTRSKASQTSD